MMEVKDGLEGEVALTSALGLSNTMCSPWGRRMSASPGVLLHDMDIHHVLPPKVPNPMQTLLLVVGSYRRA